MFEDASVGLARVLTHAERLDEAVAVLERGLRVRPESAVLLDALEFARSLKRA